MRGKSHISLGHYLLSHYLPELPVWHKRAFLLGCIQPDRNPATYLKGSLRHRWLHGHNYHNARMFSRRLEKKEVLHLFDFYTLGKLIHYTADAFTYAHNDFFRNTLSAHRLYEHRLQDHFLNYLSSNPSVDIPFSASIMDTINCFHQEYARENTDIFRDSRFALQACCCVFCVALAHKMI